MARPAVTCPPGVFTYMVIGAFGSCFSRKRSCAMIVFASGESIGSPQNMIRSSKSREYISYARSPVGVLSTMVGIKKFFAIEVIGWDIKELQSSIKRIVTECLYFAMRSLLSTWMLVYTFCMSTQHPYLIAILLFIVSQPSAWSAWFLAHERSYDIRYIVGIVVGIGVIATILGALSKIGKKNAPQLKTFSKQEVHEAVYNCKNTQQLFCIFQDIVCHLFDDSYRKKTIQELSASLNDPDSKQLLKLFEESRYNT